MVTPYVPSSPLADAYAQHFLTRFVRLTVPFHLTGAWCLGTGQRKPPATATLSQVYGRDGLTCTLCGLPGQRDTDDQWALNVDHVVPHSLRGPNHETNLRVTHRWCNAQRQLIPYPATISAADGERCRRCGERLTGDTLIEHVVELTHPAMWDPRCAWPCHRACHRPDTWPDLPLWSQPRLPNMEALLSAPLILVTGHGPEMLTTLPATAPPVVTAPLPATLPVRVRRQEEMISMQWQIPGRFTLNTVLTLEEARALARDLLIETCGLEPPSTAPPPPPEPFTGIAVIAPWSSPL
ncbi:MAG: HNH endonuclease [Ktedonobacterales bacterium]|nr:HNH endonuclease [Ktedonobacterales bacterium]